MNPGNGFVDIGSEGDSKYSNMLLDPLRNSMNPFVPQRMPPHPVKLKIKPFDETYVYRKGFYPSERKINLIKIDSL